MICLLSARYDLSDALLAFQAARSRALAGATAHRSILAALHRLLQLDRLARPGGHMALGLLGLDRHEQQPAERASPEMRGDRLVGRNLDAVENLDLETHVRREMLGDLAGNCQRVVVERLPIGVLAVLESADLIMLGHI